MFCSEVLQQPRLAFETAEQAYTAASAALPRLPQDQLEDVAPLLQRLRDRVSHWSSEVDLLGDGTPRAFALCVHPAQALMRACVCMCVCVCVRVCMCVRLCVRV